jgi:predicted PurR-regulated permease PerM
MSAQQPPPNDAQPESQRADITELATFLQGPVDIRSIALSGLLIIALGYTLYVARAVFLPIVLALLLSFLLAPLVKGLSRLLRLPAALSAAVVLLATLGLVGYGASWLFAPAASWMQQLPRSLRQIETKMQVVKESVEEVNKATKQVKELTQEKESTTRPVVRVEVKQTNLLGVVFNQTLEVVASVALTVILLYFLLASGNLFLLKLVRVLPSLTDKKVAVSIVHQVEHDVSRYLLTITMINAGLGVAVGSAMFLLGMPNAVLWGVMAGSLNFIPYLGAITSATILTLVALLTFEEVGRAVVIPLVFVVLTSLEGLLITPTVVGRRLALNPVAIFIWLIFWGWLWGIAGTLLAVPLLAVLKIVCDHVKPLAAVGEFLGD